MGRKRHGDAMSLGSIATVVLIPPVNLLPLAVGGLVLSRWRPRLGRAMTAAGVLLTWMLSISAVSTPLMRELEPPVERDSALQPAAIVILAAESQQGLAGGLEPGMDVGLLSLDRLRAGARLARQTKLPILTSGGLAVHGRPALADLMQQALERDFDLPTRWLEARSSDTWENATFSAEILRREGIDTVYVVTHSWHMRRAMIAFRHTGLKVVPAPVRLLLPIEFEFGDFLPVPSAWLQSYYASHEWIGCAVYALRDWYAG